MIIDVGRSLHRYDHRREKSFIDMIIDMGRYFHRPDHRYEKRNAPEEGERELNNPTVAMNRV